MSDDNNRVLNRMGARQLTKDELDNIGAGIPTLLSIIVLTLSLIQISFGIHS